MEGALQSVGCFHLVDNTESLLYGIRVRRVGDTNPTSRRSQMRTKERAQTDQGFRAESHRLWLVKRLRACQQELEDRLVVLIRATPADADCSEDAQFVLGQRDAVVACLRCWLIAIERGERWSAPAPPEVDVQARRAVHSGVSLSTSLTRYIVALELVWGLVLHEAETIEDATTRTDLLANAWAPTASLFACLVDAVTEAHTAESERRRKTRRRRDEDRVLGLLAGRPDIDLRGIDYNFDGYHLGLIASGAGARDALRLVAKALDLSLWLIERENDSAWGWLESRSLISTKDVEERLFSGPHHNVKVVGGRVERGIPGFCLTHKQAQTALRVARRRPQQITWYADVEAVAIVMQDEELAQSMIAAWIAPIARQRNGSVLLRTLQTFFACSHNQTETAEALPADRHTVERHLRRIGGLIGQPLQACGSRVELALQVHELWGDEGQR